MENFVHGLFTDEKGAARAVQALLDADFEPDTISALLRVEGKAEELPLHYKSGIVRGAIVGAVLGAVGGPLVAVGVGLAAAGPLLAALQGLVMGGTAGSAVGALGGLSRWKEELNFPEHEAGIILVGVSVEQGRVEQARKALSSAEPIRIHVATKAEACREVETGKLTRGPS